MKKKLIPMVDYVLESVATQDYEYALSKILNYAYFLNQKLEIWMFVPCDEDGNVLEEPSLNDFRIGFDEVDSDYDPKEVETYKQAKERVLFDGFSLQTHHLNKKSISTTDNFFHIFWDTGFGWELSKGVKTIEDLVKHNLQLTDKQSEILKL